jgi:hypothetical protein
LDSNEANNLSQDINLLFIEVHYKNFAYEESIFQWVCTIFGGRNTNHDWKRVYFRTSPEDYKEK